MCVVTGLISKLITIIVLQLNKTVFRAFGWAIRYFLVFRENYFGSFTQFQTLSEYLEKRRENLPIGDPLKLKYRPEKVGPILCTGAVLTVYPVQYA